MFSRIVKFAELPTRRKLLFLEAYATLGVMRFALLTISFKRLTQSLQRSNGTVQTDTPCDERLRMAEEIGSAIATAAGHTPWESACLVQALSAGRMLRKRGIPGKMVLGAMKDKTDGGQIKAHAWVLCGDDVVTGQSGHENFAVLSVLEWSGK